MRWRSTAAAAFALVMSVATVATDAHAAPGFDGLGGVVQGDRAGFVAGGNVWYEHSLASFVDEEWAEPVALRATVGLWPIWQGLPGVFGTRTARQQVLVPVTVGGRYAFGGSLTERGDSAVFVGFDLGVSWFRGQDPATLIDQVEDAFNSAIFPSAFVEAGVHLGGMRFSVHAGLPSLAHPGSYSLFGTLGFAFYL